MTARRAQTTGESDAAEEIPLESFLTFHLNLAHARVSADTSRYLKRRFDITVAEHRVLAFAADREPATFTRLWEATGMDRGMLSRTIAGLERKGLLARISDAGDSRIQHLRLTAEGHARRQAIRPIMQARQRRLFAMIDKEDRDAFRRVCETLIAASDLEDDFETTGEAPERD